MTRPLLWARSVIEGAGQPTQGGSDPGKGILTTQRADVAESRDGGTGCQEQH